MKVFATEAEAEETARAFTLLSSIGEHFLVGMTLDLDSYIILVYDADGKFLKYYEE